MKIGRQTIVNARQTISDVMNTINPILPTPGGGGHRLSLARTLEMILPEYFRRCALKMFADNDPDKDFKDIRIPKDENSEESEENDQYLQLDEDEFQQVLQEVGDAWAVSFDGRCSKSRALTYTSFVLSPKMESLQHEWQ